MISTKKGLPPLASTRAGGGPRTSHTARALANEPRYEPTADDIAPSEVHRDVVQHAGRGALSNPSGRFEAVARFAFDDGWSNAAGVPGASPSKARKSTTMPPRHAFARALEATSASASTSAAAFIFAEAAPESLSDSAVRPTAAATHAEPLPRTDTVVQIEAIRSIISRNDSPDIPFEQSINPYRGCEHGCIYCFARPTHAYLGLSAGLDFETKLRAKPDAAKVLQRELAKPSYQCRVIAIGSNTDPFQPIERKLGITHEILEVLDACNHPVSIVTKNARIVDELPVLQRLAARNLVVVFISLTTLDDNLAGVLEPRASRPARRLRAIAQLAQAEVPVGVLTSPMIPGLNDHELDQLLEAAHTAGARFANYNLLRLPHELRELFAEWLQTHAPTRAERVLSLMRQTRNGQLYDARFGVRQRGTGEYAEVLAQRFRLARRRFGFRAAAPKLDTSGFQPPVVSPREAMRMQLSLF